MLAITICATKSYTYAMRAQARRVVANIGAAGIGPSYVVLVGDGSKAMKEVAQEYTALLPEGWRVQSIEDEALREGGENYKESAQLLIARMRSAAFAFCRKIGAERVWSLDSDVLPPANALRCMMQMLEFDDGFYSISTCPYPNSAWLGGFGTPAHPIEEDFLPSERVLPKRLKVVFEACEQRLKGATERKLIEREQRRMGRLQPRIKRCPPDGNIWQVIAKHGWRRRGWLDNAYPGIGRGAVVPSDWCGFGCTLLNQEALCLADFDGYDGKGTEDLFVCWHRWYPAGLRLNVITHCPCDHVIWEKKKGGAASAYTHHVAYHETEGECRGHLRVRQKPWIAL